MFLVQSTFFIILYKHQGLNASSNISLYYFICFFPLALISVVYIFTLQGKPLSWQKYKEKKKPLLI